jgi:hypothetical protein
MRPKLKIALPVDFDELNVVAGLGCVESVGDESKESRNDELSAEERPKELVIDACLWLGMRFPWSRPMAGSKELFKAVAIFGPYTPSPALPALPAVLPVLL